MEDQYYREDALRFRVFLKVIFIYCFSFAIVTLTAYDLYILQTLEVEPYSNADDHSLAEYEHDVYKSNTANTIILRIIVFCPLAVFGYRFFSSER